MTAYEKWKPRTFQSAKVFFPAHDLHRPPKPIKEPVFAETHEEKFAREGRERDERLKVLNAKYKSMLGPFKKKCPTKHKPKKIIKSNFAEKQMEQLKKLAEEKAFQVRSPHPPTL